MKIKARTVFAFMFYATFCYLMIVGKDTPQSLISIVSGLLGYYFGQSMPKQKTNDRQNS